MDTEVRLSRFGWSLLMGLIVIAAAFAGSAAISNRSAAARAMSVEPKVATEVDAADSASRAGVARAATEDAPPAAPARDGAGRRKVRCAGCGVVESVRRVDRREIVGDVCSVTDFDRFQIAGHRRDADATTLAATIDGALAGRTDAKRIKVTSSYQIVVRLSDGTRRVFNEATARALQSGERVQVIAGLDLPGI